MIQTIRKILIKYSEVNLEAFITNFRRMKQISMIGILVSMFHIIYFLFFVITETKEESIWRIGIITSHSVLVILFTFTYYAITFLTKTNKATLLRMKIIQYFYIFIIMAIGAMIVTLDQLVTTNITPFLVISTFIALAFLLQPLASVPIYLVAYFIFYFSIAFIQNDPLVLASNRVNGLTAAFIGIALSNILWQYYTRDFFQRVLIEQQNTELILQKKKLEETNEQLIHLVAYDGLTGLFNRREFERIVNKTLLEMKRYKSNACIIIVDIDHFKYINDQYGHPVGDKLLKAFSFILKDELRDIDIIARWGGEEFIIMLHNTPAQDGVHVAERIRYSIENNKFLIDGHEIGITASFGISELLYYEIDWLITAYQKADKALYMAKNNGRNQCVFEPD
ncbi:MAG: GGDEF domain-containing protein [Erysipelotrichaceae bacterium]|nr:GGDEF domain-containing protein [Erysipelotrichaceae bacterium]